MFTGLVAAVGTIRSITPHAQGLRLSVDVQALPERPQIGASIAINGVCLTVTALAGTSAEFAAVAETAARTCLANKRAGDVVNLEPALRADGRLDGHLVQGHVDAVGRVLSITPRGESQIWRFSLPREIAPLVAYKGSIAVDGVSLTVCALDGESFSVSLIPHTVANTAFRHCAPGAEVNLEADVLARYIARRLEFPLNTPGAENSGGISEDLLRAHGFMP